MTSAPPPAVTAAVPEPAPDASPERRWPAFLILVAVFLIWSNSFIAARALVGDGVPVAQRLGPLDFVIARFSPVALWCLGWFACIPAARRQAAAMLGRHPLLVAALGLFNVWGYNLAFGAGHHRVPAGTGSLIIALNPVLTLVLAVILRLERPTWRKALGLAVAFAGIYVVVVHGAGQEVAPAYLGDALLLLAAPVCWACYTVLGKPLLARTSPLHLTFLVLGLASLPTLPLALLHGGYRAHLAAWGAERHAAALFLALGCTLLAFWLWYEALKRLPASTAAAFVFLNPPLTLLFQWLWFRRAPTPGLLVGGVVVLAGVYLCTRRTQSRPGRRDAGPARSRG